MTDLYFVGPKLSSLSFPHLDHGDAQLVRLSMRDNAGWRECGHARWRWQRLLSRLFGRTLYGKRVRQTVRVSETPKGYGEPCD
jgi:hypothetical protein